MGCGGPRLSTSNVTSPPRVLSRSSFKLRFNIFSNAGREVNGLELGLVYIPITSSNICAGLVSDTVVAMMAFGETKSKPDNGAVFASQAADPWRGELKLSSV